MRNPDCLLLRVGELALKSEQVQRIWFRMLLRNVRAALGRGYRLETDMNRIFVYGGAKKAVPKLFRVFGLTSLSSCWECGSGIEDINKLAVEVAKHERVGKKSFAVRARRAGCHEFTSQQIAREAGSAVVEATGAKVDLGEPDIEINIECRQRKAYVFSEKVPCAGGLPAGTGGRALAVVNGRDDAVAAWLIAKRGVDVETVGKRAGMLSKWGIRKKSGQKDDYAGYQALIIGEKSRPPAAGMLVLRPLVAWTGPETAAAARKIGLK